MSTSPPNPSNSGPSTFLGSSIQGTINTPVGPLQAESFTRLIERIGVLILLGGVLHYVLNGQSALIALKLDSIDRRLEAMNQRFDAYLDTETAERNRLP